MVFELDVCTEDVRGSPGLGDCETVRAVRPLGFNVASDELRLGVTVSGSLEGYTGRSGSFDLEVNTLERIILAKQVTGGLSKVLGKDKLRKKQRVMINIRTFQEGGTG